MKRIENACLDCTGMGKPCMGSTCPQREAVIYECDECHEEVDELYELDGEELCKYCVLDRLEKVT